MRPGGGGAVSTVFTHEEFAAFDQLPPGIRALLAGLPYKISSQDVLAALDDGMSVHVAAMDLIKQCWAVAKTNPYGRPPEKEWPEIMEALKCLSGS